MPPSSPRKVSLSASTAPPSSRRRRSATPRVHLRRSRPGYLRRDRRGRPTAGRESGTAARCRGMVPPNSNTIKSEVKRADFVAIEADDGSHVALFQSTPARFDGRPEAVAAMTRELQAAHDASGVDDQAVAPRPRLLPSRCRAGQPATWAVLSSQCSASSVSPSTLTLVASRSVRGSRLVKISSSEPAGPATVTSAC